MLLVSPREEAHNSIIERFDSRRNSNRTKMVNNKNGELELTLQIVNENKKMADDELRWESKDDCWDERGCR
jgi:hypothetical protein